MDNLADEAIKAFLGGDIPKAIEINETIIKKNPNDIEALIRLGCAYFKIGKTLLAKKYLKKAAKIDPYHPIIIKNLKKISTLKRGKINFFCSKNQIHFLYEPGITKIVSLVNPTSPSILNSLEAGIKVNLKIKRKSIFVYLPQVKKTKNKEIIRDVYLGALPDDLSFRLIPLIKGGNCYEAFISSIQNKTLTIFLKEMSRSKKYQNIPSFREPQINPNDSQERNL